MNESKFIVDNRRFIIAGAVIVIVVVFIIRLFVLQISSEEYKQWADSNAFLKKTIYPSRGSIYDREGRLLVFNQPAYDVMLIMREVQPFDTLDFCNTLGITKEIFDKRIVEIKDRRLNPGYSSYVPQLFMNQLGVREYGILQEKLYKFPGFYIQNRTIRDYQYPNAALLLGSVGQVNKKDLLEDSYYVQGDESGRSGVEKSYEQALRGEKGVEILLRDAHGRVKGKYENGEYDIAPISGKNLTLSIDMELQAYGEKLMQNKIGSIVMIEPATGEILCLVSAPSYDPRLLVGRQRGNNYTALEKNPLKVLLNRPIMSANPPGSTFKPAQGLVYLQEGVITPQTAYSCAMGYTFRGGKPACHAHPSPLSLVPALATSCNSYFCWGLHDMLDNRRRYPTIQEGLEVWKDHMVSMGYGYKLGVDLPSEQRGLIPNSKYYAHYYGNRWTSSTIISIGIGQGEILATPLQICNLSATIANRGHFITPHAVKEVEDTPLDSLYTNRRYTTINQSHYLDIVEGMTQAVLGGTCRGAAIPGIQVCGKTGTTQNPHGKDHSVFIGFAPRDNPKVAICVYIENGGFGATYGVPIGRLMMETYLNGKISEASKYTEELMLNAVIMPGRGY